MSEGNKLIRCLKLINMRNIRRTTNYIKNNGLHGLKRKIMHSAIDPLHYNEWFLRHKVSEEALEAQRSTVFEGKECPLISIVVPTYNTDEAYLRDMIDSVVDQTYPNWELCIAEASDSHNRIVAILEDYKARLKDPDRIKYIEITNSGISDNTNAAIELATGQYIGLLDHDDVLEPDALYEIWKAIVSDGYDVIYTDEDKYDVARGEYMEPNLKSDFNIDLLRSYNYITHFFVAKKTLIDQVGGLKKEYDGAQDYDFIFRCTEEAEKIGHISKVLYHWRIFPGSTADNPEQKMYCYDSGKKAIEDHLTRMGIKAKVSHDQLLGVYHTVYETDGNPLISIVIPNMDHRDLLDTCISSIFDKSDYKNIEVIVVENNSKLEETFDYYKRLQAKYDNVLVVNYNEAMQLEEVEFNFSKLNNFGVSKAKGQYILLLNNDTEMISETALSEMVGLCQRSDVGIVGAKLLYGDNTVQHAGVVIGFDRYAGHVFLGLEDDDFGYLRRARVNCDYSSVTAACLMIKRDIFDQVNGLDENYAVACNDVDLCLKVREQGYLVVYNAYSKWYHYESKSRGYDEVDEAKNQRFEKEKNYFRNRWNAILENGDPYYNKNFPLDIAPFTLD